MTELLDLLGPVSDGGDDRIFGVVVGWVTNNGDPEKLGRVRVRFPWLSDDDESWWARIAAPAAGKSGGAYFLPEVDDEVLVAFENGDPRFPYVLGALWNSNLPPPLDNAGGKNNKRTIVSRSGHTIVLDDTEGEEKIEIVDKTKHNSIVISTKDNSLTITTEGDITISAGKNVTVDAGGELTLKAASTTVVKGKTINLN
jgi:uncharacterized protein involved in type VI secretion and phage assembly